MGKCQSNSKINTNVNSQIYAIPNNDSFNYIQNNVNDINNRGSTGNIGIIGSTSYRGIGGNSGNTGNTGNRVKIGNSGSNLLARKYIFYSCPRASHVPKPPIVLL